MATVHDEIDNWLAADLYGELSNRGAAARLHTHLVECAACQKNSSGNQNHEQNSGRNSRSGKTRSALSNSECWPVFAIAFRNEADS